MFPHEYRRALEEMALEEEAARKLEQEALDKLSNEFDEDSVYVDELKTPKDAVSYSLRFIIS